MVARCVYIQSVDNLKYYVQLDDALRQLDCQALAGGRGGGGAIYRSTGRGVGHEVIREDSPQFSNLPSCATSLCIGPRGKVGALSL